MTLQVCYGYRWCRWKLVLFYAACFLSLGILYLVTYWRPRWRMLLTRSQCWLREADAILIQVSIGHYCGHRVPLPFPGWLSWKVDVHVFQERTGYCDMLAAVVWVAGQNTKHESHAQELEKCNQRGVEFYNSMVFLAVSLPVHQLCWIQVLFMAAAVHLSTQSRKLPIGNWYNLVGTCHKVNAGSGWKLVTFDLWPLTLRAIFVLFFISGYTCTMVILDLATSFSVWDTSLEYLGRSLVSTSWVWGQGHSNKKHPRTGLCFLATQFNVLFLYYVCFKFIHCYVRLLPGCQYTGTVDCLERLVSEATCCMLSGMRDFHFLFEFDSNCGVLSC